jgi:itaconate CoA-transferase
MSATTSRPLEDIRVIALEQAVAGPLCTRYLADLGAEVVKVERPPGGDFARFYDSVVHGESAYFVWLNYGKRSVALDLSTSVDRTIFDRLLDGADVLVHNLGPGAVDRLGYAAQRLRRRWPLLIGCQITGFGSDGPYRDHKAFDLLIQAESGLASVTGSGETPARVGISIADISAGTLAVAKVLGALRQRDRTGVGSHVEVAMLDCLAEWMAVPSLFERYAGTAPRRAGLHHPSIAPYGSYRASSGPPVVVAVHTRDQWQRLCLQVLEMPELAEDVRFADNQARVSNRDALDSILTGRFERLTRAELLHRLETADIPNGNVNDVADLLTHPQLAARRRWTSIETSTGPVIMPRSPIGDGARKRVPDVGVDGQAVIRNSLARRPVE